MTVKEVILVKSCEGARKADHSSDLARIRLILRLELSEDLRARNSRDVHSRSVKRVQNTRCVVDPKLHELSDVHHDASAVGSSADTAAAFVAQGDRVPNQNVEGCAVSEFFHVTHHEGFICVMRVALSERLALVYRRDDL